MTPQRVHPCLVLWGWASLALAPCGDGAGPTALPIETLASNLEYPKGLWLAGGSAYLTETAGRNTTFGGRVRLARVDLGTRLLTPLVDSPVNSDAVVVTANGSIYQASYQGALPGELGQVSVVDPVSLVETPVTDLAIAVTDMFLDANGDMYVLGASDDTSAASLYRLPATSYADTSVVKRGLGRARALTRVGTDIYYASLQGVWRLDAAGLAGPLAVRYDPGTGRLYFLEGGSAAGQFKDGAFKAVQSGLTSAPPTRLP